MHVQIQNNDYDYNKVKISFIDILIFLSFGPQIIYFRNANHIQYICMDEF